MSGMTKVNNTQSVEFIERRWDVVIRVTFNDGEVLEWVVSADSAYTDGSGIWFGTSDEYNHELI